MSNSVFTIRKWLVSVRNIRLKGMEILVFSVLLVNGRYSRRGESETNLENEKS